MGMYRGDSDLQLERINIYFTEATTQGKYMSRSVFTDLDEYSVNKIRNSMYGQLFRPDLVVNGKMSASNNFAKEFLTEVGIERIKVMNETRYGLFQELKSYQNYL